MIYIPELPVSNLGQVTEYHGWCSFFLIPSKEILAHNLELGKGCFLLRIL